MKKKTIEVKEKKVSEQEEECVYLHLFFLPATHKSDIVQIIPQKL